MNTRNRFLAQICWSPDDAPAASSVPASGGSSSPAAPTPPTASSSEPAAAPASSPTPAAAPSGEPAAAPAEPAPFDFDTILGGDGGLPQETVVPAAAAPAAAPVAPPVTPPVAAPAAPAQTPPVVPPVQTPAAAAPAPQEASPPLNPADPSTLADAITANEATIIDHVAQTMFQLSPEDREALETDMYTAVPKLMAKSFVRSHHNILKQLATTVPRMIERHLAVSKRNTENSDKFYSRWPDIKKAEHGEAVNRFAHTFRQMNPNASLEQMIEEVGAMVMVASKIAASPAASAPAGTPAKPFTPVANASQPAPFTPAVGGGGASPTPAEGNPWDILGGEA